MFSLEKRFESLHKDAILTVNWQILKEDSELGKILSSGFEDTIKVWSLEKGNNLKLEKSLGGNSGGVVSSVLSSSGDFLATCSLDSTIRLWNTQTWDFSDLPLTSTSPDCWTIHITADSQNILCGSGLHGRGKIQMVNIETGMRMFTVETLGKICLCLAVSGDGSFIACGGLNGLVSLLDGKSGLLIRTLESHTKPVRSVVFSPDSHFLLTAADDKTIKIYAMPDLLMVTTLSCHSGWVLALAFSPDGRSFASSGTDKSVKIWDMKTLSRLHTFKSTHTESIWTLSWGSNSKLISGGEDGAINLYTSLK